MTVSIQPNMYQRQLRSDLATLLGATRWSVDANQTVTVTTSGGHRAGQLLYELVRSNTRVLLVGDEGASKFTLGGQVTELRGVGGITQADTNPPQNIVVGYDVTSCYGNGYVVRGADGSLIPFPGHILLGHELAHAVQMVSGKFTTREAAERFAVDEENVQRRIFNLPARDTSSFATMVDGGCKPAPPKKTQTTTTGGCFVASAAYGSALHPAVDELRVFREEVLRSTTHGRRFWEEFFDTYAHVSTPVVEAMVDPRVRELTRWALVTPIVHYLRVARAFPDADLTAAGPEWQPFLTELRDMLGEFAAVVPLPSGLASLPPAEAGHELAVALRYMLRDDARRREWLDGLVELGELPLRGTPDELEAARAKLRALNRPEHEIVLVTGSADAVRSGTSPAHDEDDGPPPLLCGFGQIHVDTQPPADRSRWLYTVTLRNATTDTFTNVRCFYLVRPGNLDNMGMTVVGVINPGDVVVFPLGICSEVESYFLEGDFTQADGLSGQFTWPNVGPMTPSRASAVNATDTFLCEDSFQFTF